MRANKSGVRVVMLVCACAILFGCPAPAPEAPEPEAPEPEAPEVTFVSPAEAAELWEAAESRQPVGDPFVEDGCGVDGRE